MVGGGFEHTSAAHSATTQSLSQQEAGVSLFFFLSFSVSVSLSLSALGLSFSMWGLVP